MSGRNWKGRAVCRRLQAWRLARVRRPHHHQRLSVRLGDGVDEPLQSALRIERGRMCERRLPRDDRRQAPCTKAVGIESDHARRRIGRIEQRELHRLSVDFQRVAKAHLAGARIGRRAASARLPAPRKFRERAAGPGAAQQNRSRGGEADGKPQRLHRQPRYPFATCAFVDPAKKCPRQR